MQSLVQTLDFIFGCHHTHLIRVFTIEHRTYRVCCDCGAKFEYSLESMCMERRLSTLDLQQFLAPDPRQKSRIIPAEIVLAL